MRVPLHSLASGALLAFSFSNAAWAKPVDCSIDHINRATLENVAVMAIDEEPAAASLASFLQPRQSLKNTTKAELPLPTPSSGERAARKTDAL